MLNWHDTSFDIGDAQPDMALWPIGAMESHGPHLPVGTHWLLLEVIAQRIAARLPYETYLLPTWPFGTSISYKGLPGTVYLGWETLMEVVRDVVESLYERGLGQSDGIPRVTILVDLGGANESLVRPRGNYIVKTAVRQLNYAYPHQQTIWVQPFTTACDDFLQIFDSADQEIQAGEVETSCLMAAYPELVKGSAKDTLPSLSKEYLDYLPFECISARGIWGRPSLASPKKGEQALSAAVDRTCEYIEGVFSTLEELKTRFTIGGTP